MKNFKNIDEEMEYIRNELKSMRKHIHRECELNRKLRSLEYRKMRGNIYPGEVYQIFKKVK